MAKLIVVSNRLPVTIKRRGKSLSIHPSTGGLATGLGSLPEAANSLWIGWPGLSEDQLSQREQQTIAAKLTEQDCSCLWLSQQDVEDFYHGFSNETIWPLFHYFPLHTVYHQHYWQAYRRVNEMFCQHILRHAQPEDTVWIHDYQLMLLPEMLRRKLPSLEIGFFLHIPWPSYELFRLLPWRSEILDGLLGSDLIGFHTYDYVRHFLSSVARLIEVEHSFNELMVHNRLVKVDAFPMGIDFHKYADAMQQARVQREAEKMHEKLGDCSIVLSIDRLDYTKGIIQRLEAFDLFLQNKPDYRGKVSLILVAVPSRTKVQDYADLREHLDGLVGRINGGHGSIGWMPVWYLYRELPFERLAALYNIADVALVTPLRDGMNLIAKEFVASRTSGMGVLVLSEMAGAASELGEALTVNANDREAVAYAIKEALEMPPSEQIRRNELMRHRLQRYDVKRWAGDFFETLHQHKQKQRAFSVRKLVQSSWDHVIEHYRQCHKRLILLDYDGTLVSFVKRPEDAAPDEEICQLLSQLAQDQTNEVVVVSGRDRHTLTQWLGHLPINLVAEHGAWLREIGHEWRVVEPFTSVWKDSIRPIFQLYVDRTPGSAIEEKDFALVWHYRRAVPELAHVRTQELKAAVQHLTTNLDIGAFEGNKILEVKNIGINKGRSAELWFTRQRWDFTLAIGDDYTDEDMFAVLGEDAYSIKVGSGISKARFYVDSVRDVRLLLTHLVGS